MADELVFYTNPRSRGRIARWMLEEVGQPYRTEVLDYGTTMKAPAYLAINPMGKVPALQPRRDGGDRSRRHLRLSRRRISAGGPGARRRAIGCAAPYYRWLFFAAGPVEAAVSNKALGFAVPPEREGMMGYGSLERVMKVLEDAVSRADYLVGGRFSAADVYIGSQIGFGLMFGTIEKRPAFQQYWQRLSARPAYTRARELDDAPAAKQ